MKVTTTKIKSAFTPFSITINVDTLEELETLWRRCSVPDNVVEDWHASNQYHDITTSSIMPIFNELDAHMPQ